MCLENSLIMEDQDRNRKVRVAPLAELTGIQFGVVNEEDIVSFTSMQSFVFLLDLLLLTTALH